MVGRAIIKKVGKENVLICLLSSEVPKQQSHSESVGSIKTPKKVEKIMSTLSLTQLRLSSSWQ